MEREACVCDHGYERSDLCAEIIIIIIRHEYQVVLYAACIISRPPRVTCIVVQLSAINTYQTPPTLSFVRQQSDQIRSNFGVGSWAESVHEIPSGSTCIIIGANVFLFLCFFNAQLQRHN